MKIIKRIGLLLIIALITIVYFNYPKLNLISGFAAKNMASSVFIADRNSNDVRDNDHNIPLVKFAEVTVDNNSASSTVFGLMPRKSVSREGLGCLLINDDFDMNKPYLRPNRALLIDTLAFPYGNTTPKDTIFENVNYPKLIAAITNSFSDPEINKTRTVLVYHKNRIIGEQ